MSEKRLIDADELKYRILKYSLSHMLHQRKKILRDHTQELYRDIAFGIDAMPTIEERRTGKWEEICKHEDMLKWDRIKDLQSIRCSVCGHYLITPYKDAFRLYRFCPNCGTEMNES